jgi:hypothetical protein
MKVSDELYNPGPILTFEGAAIAVLTASGAVGHALDFNPKWLGLVIALAIPFGGLLLLPEDSDVWRSRRAAVGMVALFHGLVIYNLAVGLNALHQATPKPHAVTATVVQAVDPLPWWTSVEQESAARKLITAIRLLKLENSEVTKTGTARLADLESIMTKANAAVELPPTQSRELALRRVSEELKTLRAEVNTRREALVVAGATRNTSSAEHPLQESDRRLVVEPSSVVQDRIGVQYATLEKLADDLELAYSKPRRTRD